MCSAASWIGVRSPYFDSIWLPGIRRAASETARAGFHNSLAYGRDETWPTCTLDQAKRDGPPAPLLDVDAPAWRTSKTAGSCSVVRAKMSDTGPDDSDSGRLYGDDDETDVDQDPVRSLRDTQEAAGDEVGISDTYSVDALEAKQMRVALDPAGDQEATLN